MRALWLLVLLTVTLFAAGSVALACSSSPRAPSDAGADGHADASAGVNARDATPESTSPDASSPPTLTALSVSSTEDSAPLLSLVPAFSPSIYDYAVYCAAGTNALTVAMRASSGAESRLVLPTKSPEKPEQTLSVSVLESDAIVAAATSGTATTEYWIRCLPHEWNLHPEAGAPSPGYYLLGTAFEPATVAGYAMVLDVRGVPVWYAALPEGVGAVNVDTVVDGAISFIANPSNGQPYEIQRLDPFETTSAGSPGVVEDPHELRVDASGHYVVFSSPLVTGVDLTGLSLPLPDGGVESLGPDETILGCDILELDPTGAVDWEWRILDHLDPAQDCLAPMLVGPQALPPDAGTTFDVFHCNSIDIDEGSGNLLVSARQLDSIFYIDRGTSKILWKMGGGAFTRDNAAYVPVADPFYGQHDARLGSSWAPSCAGGSGQISLFDDHSFAPGRERGVIYDVHVDPGDGGTADCGTSGDASSGATVAWQYAGPVSSGGLGSMRIQSDGSKVIGWGYGGGSANLTFTEVDPSDHDVLDVSPVLSYRVVKVPLAAFDLSVLRSTAGRN
jgi:Arylsulfotransferase (ASST)